MQWKKLFIGNLSKSVTIEDIEEPFADYDSAGSIKFMRGKGFGLVDFADAGEADSAIDDLDGIRIKGQAVKAEEAREPKGKRGHRDEELC
ncbi:MAG: RNA recognition motif domain-containing protein [Planctomycetota bacterium]|jgi:RNA recognition motif-containing protein